MKWQTWGSAVGGRQWSAATRPSLSSTRSSMATRPRLARAADSSCQAKALRRSVPLHPGDIPGENRWFLQSTPIQMLPQRGSICGRLTSNSLLGCLQGGEESSSFQCFQPHSGLRSDFRPIWGQKCIILFVGTLQCACGDAYGSTLEMGEFLRYCLL